MEDDNVPVLTVEQKVLLQKLKIWDKIASGNLHSIALPDVQALFDILDPGEKGHITRGECYSLLQIQNVKISRNPTNLSVFYLSSDMGVSKNRDTPKWMVYDGKPY